MTRARLVIGALGLALAVVGVVRDDRRITWVAIALLAVAIALRLRRPTR